MSTIETIHHLKSQITTVINAYKGAFPAITPDDPPSHECAIYKRIDETIQLAVFDPGYLPWPRATQCDPRYLRRKIS